MKRREMEVRKRKHENSVLPVKIVCNICRAATVRKLLILTTHYTVNAKFSSYNKELYVTEKRSLAFILTGQLKT